MEKMKKKVYDGYLILFFILHMCAGFHHDRTKNKDFFLFWANGPLNIEIKFPMAD